MKRNITVVFLVLVFLMGTLWDVSVAVASEQAEGGEEKVCLVLDPGHGGSDPGTEGASTLGSNYEKVYTLKVAQYVKEILESNGGFEVYLTRDTDKDVSANERLEYADQVNADAFISLHFNSGSSASVRGAEIWQSVIAKYRLSNLPDLFLQQLNCVAGLDISRGVKSRASENKTYWNSIMNWDTSIATGQLADYYAQIKGNAKRGIPAVIVEHAFLTNAEDLAIVNTEDGLQKMAEADANALIEFYTKHVHTYNAFSVDYPVSCIFSGKGSEHCSICGKRRNVKALASSPNAALHFYEDTILKAATVSETGLVQKVCQYNKSHQEQVVLSKLNAPVVSTPTSKPAAAGTSTSKKLKVGKTAVLKWKKKKSSFVVTCKKVSGAKGYQVQVALNRKMRRGKKSVLSSKNKVMVKKCKKKKYYVRARAYKIDSNKKKVYGLWSKIRIAK